MKIKSLLLGTAAGLVAVTGAQAADLPVKAKAVAQYVKICTLYGAGFYYVPGTDTCVKYSGYVRADYYYNGRGGGSPNYSGANARQTLTDNNEFGWRSRGVLAIDGRNETAYGTVRTLIQMGVTNDSPNSSNFYFNRALIQFAGFTFGRSKTPFNIWSCDDSCRHSQNQASSSNSSGGSNVLSYTAEFGGGLSGTVYIEDARNSGVAALGGVVSGAGGSIGTSNSAQHYPDFGANILLNQAWGYVGASVAGHNAVAGYYGTTTTTGHPGEKLGWAAEVGGEIKLPWLGNAKDRFGIDFAYGEGYYANSGGNNLAGPSLYGSGNTVGVGYMGDGLYSTAGGDIQLVTAWALNTGIEHYWADNLRTSLYYIRAETSFNGASKALVCPTGAGAGAGNVLVGGANCNPNWGFFQIGSRTVWSPVANLNIGLDVFYTGIETAYKGSTLSLGAAGARPAGSYTIRDQGIVTAVVRVQKNLIAGGGE